MLSGVRIQQGQTAFGGEVTDAAPGPFSGDEPAITQDAEVLGHSTRRHAQFPGEASGGVRASAKSFSSLR